MTKDRVYYLVFGDCGTGVDKKIAMQLKTMSCHFSVSLLHFKSFKDFTFDKITDTPSFFYIRKKVINSKFIKILKSLKTVYPDSRIILEMPVYPYYRELFCRGLKRSILNIPVLLSDILFRGKLRAYVDYVSTFSEDKTIFGIPTIRIYNGVCVEAIQLIKNDTLSGSINIAGVAVFAPQHGYERIIKGLHLYYSNGGTRNVVFHLVGYGLEEKKYRRLVKDYHLEKHVLFYGKMTGDKLDKLYETMDFGVTHLAMYKVNRPLGSFIKTGEYLAKGLPIICGSKIDVLENVKEPVYIRFENNPSPICIDDVIDFYDSLYFKHGKKSIKLMCRKIACENADMNVSLKNLIDVIKTTDSPL